MAEKRDSYQPGSPGGPQGGGPGLPSQESIDLVIRLLQEFERRTPGRAVLSPEVARDVAFTNAAFDSIVSGLALADTPAITIASINPNRGGAAGGTRVTLTGTRFVTGATVRVGGVPATAVAVVSPTEIQATTPAAAGGGSYGAVDVIVETIAGSARLAKGFTYQS